MESTSDGSLEPVDEFGLKQLLGIGITIDEIGYPVRAPLLVLALPGGHDAGRIDHVLEGLPAVVVGVAAKPYEEPPSCDVLLTDESDPPCPWIGCPDGTSQAVERLLRCIRSRPIASVVFTQLLRLGPSVSVGDGLVAESLAYSTLQSGPEYQAWLAARKARRKSASLASRVVVRRDDNILTIVLNRPEVHNALDSAMRDDLVAALGLAAADPMISQVVISGAGPSFCSGGDFEEFGSSPDPASAHLIRTTRNVGRSLHACADRCVVRVHGHCFGAGVELAAFAGRVRASRDTTFSLPELEMGLVPGAGGTVSIPRRIGRERTAYLGLTAEPIDVETARGWGLVDEIAG